MSVLRKENSGLDAMIDIDSVVDLSRLFTLYEKVSEGVPSIRRAIKESIVRRGTALNTVTNGEGEAVGVDEEAEVRAPRMVGSSTIFVMVEGGRLSIVMVWRSELLL